MLVRAGSLFLLFLAVSFAPAIPHAKGQPVISEFLASNQTGLEDEDGDFTDWIEIHNPTAEAVNLAGWTLTDDASRLDRWAFPAQVLDPGAYLVVHASGKDRRLPPLVWNTPISRRHLWRYRVGTTEPPEDWANPEFDDSDWPEGPSGFGYGDGDDDTIVPNTMSVYVRTVFHLEDVGNVARAVLHVDYDDAFVAYVNGVEVARANIGEPGNRPAFDAPANTAVEARMVLGLFPEAFEITDHAGVLRDGENVLAIQVHNSAFDSSDLSLIPFLSIGYFEAPSHPYHADAALLRALHQRLHTNFSLSKDGEYLGLTPPGSNSPASDFGPSYPPQYSDISYGRMGTEVGYLLPPTPGEPNQGLLGGRVEPPVFSVQRGFFESEFQLTLHSSSPAVEIRFTRNGSKPTATNGQVYSGPIEIAGTAVLRAGAFREGSLPSDVVTQSYLFVRDVVTQSPTGQPPYGWPANWGRNVVDYGMDPDVVGPPGSASHRAVIDGLLDLPSVSIVTDSPHLFDIDTGIYANAQYRGRDWERPTSVELIHPDRTTGFQIDARLRIRGGYSRDHRNPKHAFRLFFRDTPLRYPVFGREGADEFTHLDLRTSQNYSWSYMGDERNVMIRDVFSRDLQGEMEDPYTRSRFYHLYINGHYWGLFMSQERAEADFGATYLGGRSEGFDVLKSTERHQGFYDLEASDGNTDAWVILWNLANELADAQTLEEKLALYQQMQGLNRDGTRNKDYPVLLDVDNLIRYMLVIFYTGNLDAPLAMDNANVNNFFSIRDREGERGFVHFAHDAEHTLLNPYENRTGPYPAGHTFIKSNPQWIHQQLTSLEEYRVRFADEASRLTAAGAPLTPEASIARFMARAEEIRKPILVESARWGDAKHHPPLGVTHWQRELDRIVKEYFPVRTKTLIGQLKQARRYTHWHLGAGSPSEPAPLYPSVSRPQLSRTPGALAGGDMVRLSAAEGRILYATGGRDPRQFGGEIAPWAIEADTVSVRPNERLHLKARVLSGGVWSVLQEVVYTADAVPPADKNLRITEVMYFPAPLSAAESEAGHDDPSDFEFVEFTNVGREPLQVGGVVLEDAVSSTLPDGVLAPGQSGVVVRRRGAFRFRYGSDVRILGSWSGKLANDGEVLVVRNGLTGERITAVEFGPGTSPARAAGRGSSVEWVSESGSGSWVASTAYGGTPGSTASVSAPPIRINEVSCPLAGSCFVELSNVGPESVFLGGWILSGDSGELRLPLQLTVSPGAVVSVSADDVGKTPAEFAAVFNGTFDLLAIDETGKPRLFADSGALRVGGAESWMRAGDNVWYPAARPTPGEALSEPRIGPVVIRELMYYPLHNDLNLEYAKVENIGGEPVDITGWRFTGAISRLFDRPTVLTPGGWALAVSFDPLSAVDRGQLFEAVYRFGPHASILGPWTGRLDNVGERLTLERPVVSQTDTSWVVVDEVTYSNKAPWPEDAAGTGRAIRREPAGGAPYDPASWQAVDRIGRTEDDIEVAVDHFVVYGPWPNPSSSVARFTVGVEEAQDVNVALFDLLGRRVGEVFRSELAARRHRTVELDVHTLPSGVYFLRITGADFAKTVPVTVAR